MTVLKNYLKPLVDMTAQLVTGGCCQWRGRASYESDVHFETVVLRRKFSDEPPNSTPPERYTQLRRINSFEI